MIEGGCLCGKVSYRYNGEITEIALCHCPQCRQAQGGAYATNSPIELSKLELMGKESIKEFQSNDVKVRAFCENCGSALYSAKKTLPGIVRLRLGTVKTLFACDRKYHQYVDSKASWLPITDDYPQYSDSK